MDSAHSKTHRAQPDVLEFYGPRVGPAGDFARPPSKAAQESPCSTRKNRPLLKTLRFYCPALVSFPVLDNNSHHFLVATSEAEQILGAQAFCRSAMSKHMDASLRALCFFYRNPPPGSGVRPQPYKEIAKLIRRPRMPAGTIRSAVKRFLAVRRVRGRKEGWRKTTPAEDAKILAAFRKVRKPLGSLVEKNDVWKALPLALREKVSARTVSRRLRDKGYVMEEKLTGDDHGEQWRKRRLRFCKTHQRKTPRQWMSCVQAVADFRYFVYYPSGMKARRARKSAPRTIMSRHEKKTRPFLKPRKAIFKRSEYKRAQKAKVFGLTTSTGASLICHVPTKFCAADWVKLIRRRVGPFMREQFPDRRMSTIFARRREGHAHKRGEGGNEAGRLAPAPELACRIS